MIISHFQLPSDVHSKPNTKSVTQQDIEYQSVPPTFGEIRQKMRKCHLMKAENNQINVIERRICIPLSQSTNLCNKYRAVTHNLTVFGTLSHHNSTKNKKLNLNRLKTWKKKHVNFEIDYGKSYSNLIYQSLMLFSCEQ